MTETQKPASKTPTTEQRRKALDLAVGLAAAHTALAHPGDAALLWADKFANYLATGATK
jgi:hypothetical protein